MITVEPLTFKGERSLLLKVQIERLKFEIEKSWREEVQILMRKINCIVLKDFSLKNKNILYINTVILNISIYLLSC